jgi:IclR family transcriptional regulator, pca regulon regulatory protein
MDKSAFEQGPDYVQSLARGLRVLGVFGHDLPNPTLSEVAERSDLSRAAARRSLLTLQHLGYVGSRGRSFFLTPRVLELGYSYLSSLDLTELAQQAMEQLSHEVQESCSLAVLDGSDVVYVLRVPVRRIMRIALGVGARLPAFTASLGRVILADMGEADLDAWIRGMQFHAYTAHTVRNASELKRALKRVRQQGYALTSQELELGLCSIAVPVRAGNGRVVAGLNVSMQFNEQAEARAVARILPVLLKTREAIEDSIRRGGWMPHMHMTYANE